MSDANNKGADQLAHPRSLISAFVVRCLDSIISLDSTAEISRLASFCGCTGRFESDLVGNSQRQLLSCLSSYLISPLAIEKYMVQVSEENLDGLYITLYTGRRQATLCLRAFRHDKF